MNPTDYLKTHHPDYWALAVEANKLFGAEHVYLEIEGKVIRQTESIEDK